MKKSIIFVFLILFSLLLVGQEQEQEQIPVQPAEPATAQAVEPPPAQPVQGQDLKRVRIPKAFIHAGKEYPAGDYWMVLADKGGQRFFAVQNERKEPLFEELAIVKARSGGGGGFRVSKQLTADREYFRVKVTTAGEWLMGYFLVKK